MCGIPAGVQQYLTAIRPEGIRGQRRSRRPGRSRYRSDGPRKGDQQRRLVRRGRKLRARGLEPGVGRRHQLHRLQDRLVRGAGSAARRRDGRRCHVPRGCGGHRLRFAEQEGALELDRAGEQGSVLQGQHEQPDGDADGQGGRSDSQHHGRCQPQLEFRSADPRRHVAVGLEQPADRHRRRAGR